MKPAPGKVLSQELLDTLHQRAPGYDLDNAFCHADIDDLKEAGFFRMCVPESMGGLGMTFEEIMRETRTLAYYAPATALCANMHTYWCGVALSLHLSGDHSCDWILEEAMAGEIFAAGHSEAGNTVPLLMSTTQAEKVEGGYRFTGRKGFGSLSPVWTRYGIHGLDASDPENPKIIHAFMNRDNENYEIMDNWDVMGMRATGSNDTVLNGAFVPDDRISRIVPAGAGGVDLFVLSIFAWALTAFANIYYSIANRICDLTFEAVKGKDALGLSGSMSQHPETQHHVAEMLLEMEAMEPQLDRMGREWTEGVDHGPFWVVRIVSTKYNVVEAAWRVADMGMEISGGFGMFKKSELERLFRDCRAGRFHPANSNLTHELLSKGILGIDLDAPQRWG
jgi:alkylation response protein AidB-like acyl-CoA dehydrogenase